MAACLLAPAGCRARPDPAAAGGLATPSWEALSAAHNARVGGLGPVYADGVIELLWNDERGRHFEQGQIEMWLALPRRAALDVSKFGERIMWLGCDQERAWAFDFGRDGSSLQVERRTGDMAWADDLPVDPAALVALAGLEAMPPSGEVAYDKGLDAYVLTALTAPPRLRLYLDRRRALPVRAELLDGQGRVLLYSRIGLARYEAVRTPQTGLATGSVFPTLVDVLAPDDRMAVKLAVRDPTVEPAPDRYFDLEWLTGRFKPQRLEDGGLSGGEQPGGH